MDTNNGNGDTPKRTKERPKVTRAHRTPERREIDRAKMVKLLREGWSKKQIAEELGVSYNLVIVDWKEVKRELRETRDDEIMDIVNCKLEELSYIKRQAWEAWQRSKLPKVKRNEEEKTGPKGTNYTVSRVEEGQCGDNSYLNTIMECIRTEIELQGLNPPKEFRGQLNMVNWDVLAQGIPEGPVPDSIEAEIQKIANISTDISTDRGDDNTIIVPPTDSVKTEYIEPTDLSEFEGEEE